MVEMRFTMAIVFISFTYLYLDCFQDDVLAVAQYVLSKGMTTYSYVLAPILLTLALFLLQMGVCTLTQVKRRFHALTYFPSMLMLTVLTDIPDTSAICASSCAMSSSSGSSAAAASSRC